jgi:hypothetical protein
MKVISRVLVIVLMFQISGCAYMFRGTSDQITIQSPDKDSQIYLDGVLIGKGSAMATVEKGKKSTIVAKKPGCSDHLVQTGSRFDAVTLLGILLDFGVISILVVDNLTGAMWKTYPLVYNVNPIC